VDLAGVILVGAGDILVGAGVADLAGDILDMAGVIQLMDTTIITLIIQAEEVHLTPMEYMEIDILKLELIALIEDLITQLIEIVLPIVLLETTLHL
jgi:hypothetical protein